MPLTMLRPGALARVTSIHGDRRFSQRLASMGILPEAEVRLVKGGVGGPVIVEVRGTRLILGRALAHRVMVEPVA